MSCINCERKGHAASECRQAKVEKGDRPCFTCGKTGHEARMCPHKPAPRAPLKSIEDAPRRVAVMWVTDADGFKTVPPRSSGQRLGDFIASTPTPRCNINRFCPLSPEDWQDVAATAAEAPEMQSSEASRMPNLTSNIFVPILSPSTSLSLSLLVAPASGQGEVIAGRAHSPLQQLSRFYFVGHGVHEGTIGRHAE